MALEVSPETVVELCRDVARMLHGEARYGELPYVVHLESVVGVLRRFGYLTPLLEAAAWLHDTLEDTAADRPFLVAVGVPDAVIDIVEALSDAGGATRRERKAATYPKIAARRDAVIVKLADRIANVEAGGKIDMYICEHAVFRAALFCPAHEVGPLWDHLDRLLAA